MDEQLRIVDGDRVSEYEHGLPELTDLPPPYQHLIPLQLASAFQITMEPSRTNLDLNRASNNTITSMNNFKSCIREVIQEEESIEEMQRIEDSVSRNDKSVKRQRLVWTAQLHKRFVDVVGVVGIKNAVPKTIMEMMNVEGLTRENVASHLQKYRLYLKRVDGSSNDQLFESTVAGHVNEDMRLQYPMMPPPQMMHMPMVAMAGIGGRDQQYNMMRNGLGSTHQYHNYVPPNGE